MYKLGTALNVPKMTRASKNKIRCEEYEYEGQVIGGKKF